MLEQKPLMIMVMLIHIFLYFFSFYPFANAGSGDSCDVSIIRKCIRSIRLLNL
jgi:hypothetical protein